MMCLDLRVRGSGQIVLFQAFTKVHSMRATQLQRYNGCPSLTISGQAAPGESSGTALKEMEKIADQILKGSQSYEWTGTPSRRSRHSRIGLLLGLSLIVVFLLLVGLYNSSAIPLRSCWWYRSVLLGAVLFALFAASRRTFYFDVGLITIIGLAAENAILVVDSRSRTSSQPRAAPSDAGGRAATSSSDPDDQSGVHSRHGAAGDRRWGRVGQPSCHRHGVIGGMIAATGFGIFLHAALLLRERDRLSRASVHHASDPEEPETLPRQPPHLMRRTAHA